MAKLTDADGPELVRLLNALMDAAHGSLITDIDIHYRTQFVGEPDPHKADQGWSVRMGIEEVTPGKRRHAHTRGRASIGDHAAR